MKKYQILLVICLAINLFIWSDIGWSSDQLNDLKRKLKNCDTSACKNNLQHEAEFIFKKVGKNFNDDFSGISNQISINHCHSLIREIFYHMDRLKVYYNFKDENPDLAHRILGGIPFAIDSIQKKYYRINIEEKNVQPAFAVSAFGPTGVEANDPILFKLMQKGYQKGVVTEPPDQLHFYYLFSLNTEHYIRAKIYYAFEWFISNATFKILDPDNFRKSARLRIIISKKHLFILMCLLKLLVLLYYRSLQVILKQKQKHLLQKD